MGGEFGGGGMVACYDEDIRFEARHHREKGVDFFDDLHLGIEIAVLSP